MSYSLLASSRLLPKLPGVYFFREKSGRIIYVGKAKNLCNRVSSYFAPPAQLFPKTQKLVAQIASIDHVVAASEIDALILEANLIKKYQPHYNLAGKDDKRFPYIEISVKDPVPLVKIVRKITDAAKLYFGPYPTGSNVTGLLHFLRRLFPYVSQKHYQNKPCLRSHLGLCPCQNLAEYHPNLQKLIAFLSGKRQTVQRQLQKEMDLAAKNLDFEKAAVIKNKLAQIEYVTQPRNPSWEYEVNPNLVADRNFEELKNLQNLLKIPKLVKIEAYDISNLAGKNASGAQATFVNGVPEKSLYRRYKIKLFTPDDPAMIKEVLRRRLKSAVPLPELVMVDGGAGQVAAAVSVFQKTLTVIGLAKKQETVYLADGTTVQLSSDSPALHLLQRLRDEAHRFSRKYHFFLRSKKMLE